MNFSRVATQCLVYLWEAAQFNGMLFDSCQRFHSAVPMFTISVRFFCGLGWRIGKGEGYADMEYAMMVSMGAVQADTPVITIVHDCQVS